MMRVIWQLLKRVLYWMWMFTLWMMLGAVIMILLSVVFSLDIESEPSDTVVIISMVGATYIFYLWRKRRTIPRAVHTHNASVEGTSNQIRAPDQGTLGKSKDTVVKIYKFLFGPSAKTINEQARAKRQSILDELTDAVQMHRDALTMNWRSTVSINEYGKIQFDGWQLEVRRFLESIDFKGLEVTWEEAEHHVTEVIRTSEIGELPTPVQTDTEREHRNPFDGVRDALEFEAACAEVLKNLGWSTRLTSGSGDQGVDVLAQKGNLRIVVQCKMYGKPVGNKAVQEAFAGMAYANADAAAVVAPNGFTKSAKELAERTGVYLLLPKDLNKLNISLRSDS